MTLLQNKPVKVDFRNVFNKKRPPRDSLITVISGVLYAHIYISLYIHSLYISPNYGPPGVLIDWTGLNGAA